jgi:hypothetical protein
LGAAAEAQRTFGFVSLSWRLASRLCGEGDRVIATGEQNGHSLLAALLYRIAVAGAAAVDSKYEGHEFTQATKAQQDGMIAVAKYIFDNYELKGELRVALDESVKLQAHYAKLLNMHDGGKRMIFQTTDLWLARLRETGTLQNKPVGVPPTAPGRAA